MIIEIGAATGGVLATLGGVLIREYFKNRSAPKNGNGHPTPKPCPQHAVMEQRLEAGDDRMDRMETKIDGHTKDLTEIKTSIGGLDAKMTTAISFLRPKE
jgi:hypothetical protein